MYETSLVERLLFVRFEMAGYLAMMLGQHNVRSESSDAKVFYSDYVV